MEYQGIKLTEEQNFAVDCITALDDTTIQAPAGSGKTFLLKAGASELKKIKRKGAYIAFNKAIAEEAKATFPSNVECRTAHSLAYAKEGYKYKNRFRNITGGKLAYMMDIGSTRMYPTKATKGYLILDTIRKFCYSQDKEIGTQHMPYIPELVKDKETITYWYNDIPVQAEKVWNRMIDTDGDMPVTHDMYLKLWALNDPKIQKDFILFDEAQDANPVMLGIVNSQGNSQKIWVGDRHQQIYQWRGATNAMDMMTNATRASLSRSFRFGPAIAHVANEILQNYTQEAEQPIMIIGNPERESKVEEIKGCPDAIICRTNAGVITNVFKYLDKGFKVYIQGGANQLMSLLLGARDLQSGKSTVVPELALFADWAEVLEFAETENGAQIKALIRLIDTYGIDELLALLRQTERSQLAANVTITTGHKAKGLEWSKVKLADDFLYPSDERELSPGEINILYVSATRALDVLDITECLAANVQTVLKLHS